MSDWKTRYEAERAARNVVPLRDIKPLLWIDKGEWRESEIPKRPWIAPGYLMRGSVTVLSGAGAAGKSMLVIGYAVALGRGEKWGHFGPVNACRTSIYNVEDDCDEQRRRLSAALRQYDLLPAWTIGRIARLGPTQVGTLFEGAEVIETGAMAELRAHVDEFRPDVLIVDPLAELHSAEENDNTALRLIIAKLRALAVEFSMAVMVLHHSRKGGASSPGDPDTLRGASSIVGAARVVLTVCVMTKEESEELGISAESRWRFFRVDGAKSNYAAPREAEWYERLDYELDNGEVVSAALPWQAPSAAVTPDLLMEAERLIAQGSPIGPWSPKLSADRRSIAQAMRSLGVTRFPQQSKMLAELYAMGVEAKPFKPSYRSPRNAPMGLRTAAGQPENVPWLE